MQEAENGYSCFFFMQWQTVWVVFHEINAGRYVRVHGNGNTMEQ